MSFPKAGEITATSAIVGQTEPRDDWETMLDGLTHRCLGGLIVVSDTGASQATTCSAIRTTSARPRPWPRSTDNSGPSPTGRAGASTCAEKHQTSGTAVVCRPGPGPW